MSGNEFQVAGTRLDALPETEIIRQVTAWCRERSGPTRAVCFVNAWSVVTARTDDDFRQAINASDLSVVDGVPLSWLGRWLTGGACDRLSGPDLMHHMLASPDCADLRHFVYGGTQPALDRLEFRYSQGGTLRPRRIVGTFSPPFRDLTGEEEQAFLARLEALKPDVVWVCLGTARQEKWMARLRHRVHVPVLAGVGAAVDFLSGGKPRAPRWMQRCGLEWLFRLATEPHRLGRRYLVGNVLFVRLALAEVWRRRAAGGQRA